MDRGVWGATVHRVTKSQTQLKQLSTHAHHPMAFDHKISLLTFKVIIDIYVLIAILNLVFQLVL